MYTYMYYLDIKLSFCEKKGLHNNFFKVHKKNNNLQNLLSRTIKVQYPRNFEIVIIVWLLLKGHLSCLM